jgi:hypothetical protein
MAVQFQLNGSQMSVEAAATSPSECDWVSGEEGDGAGSISHLSTAMGASV